MKTKNTIALIVLLFFSCSKENITQQQVNDKDNNELLAAAARIPLNDLGKNTYMGYVGGLYPRGANKPPTKYAHDLMKISKSIVPIDTFGNISDNGKIVFIS